MSVGSWGSISGSLLGRDALLGLGLLDDPTDAVERADRELGAGREGRAVV